mmetsp:Transcript_7528/g.20958  ORF Transcript_7528/g.20958 Transcript_7528/m.20958 type:complete len:113 (-) Transcript_7528:38-376(-)
MPLLCRCSKNFSLSKEMEPHCILQMLMYLASEYGVYVQHLVSDDDATIRTRLQHPGEHDEGELPRWCITPLKWADPNHRGKCAGDQATAKPRPRTPELRLIYLDVTRRISRA